jgi:hypothetical protein
MSVRCLVLWGKGGRDGGAWLLMEACPPPRQTEVYHHSKVPQWTSEVIEGTMKKLTQLQKPFKYIGPSICVVPQMYPAKPTDKPWCACPSELHHHAEKWRWTSHSQFMLLGQSN